MIINSCIYASKKFITNLIIVSFSSDLDSAIIKVIATKALSEIICFPLMIKWLFYLEIQEKLKHQCVYNHQKMGDPWLRNIVN